jgi:hypothetical protein
LRGMGATPQNVACATDPGIHRCTIFSAAISFVYESNRPFGLTMKTSPR